jgi:hypothetical protein
MHTAEQHSPLAGMNEDDHRKVRVQLERLLDSHQFRNSRRYPALLRYLVEEALEGRGDYLKERLIGIHVFGRPADYDTASDPIVRVTIAEIRKRIAQYYHDEDHDAEIRIELITGRYAPEFRLRRESRHDTPVEHAIEEALTSAEPVAAFPPVTAPAEPAPEPRRALRRHALAWVPVLLLLALATAFFIFRGWKATALDNFWAPIVGPHSTVLFCLPASVGYKKGLSFVPKTALPSAGPTFLDHESLGENIVYSDMLATLAMANVLTSRHTDYRVRLNVATTLDDLRHGPTIVVGGLDNEWALRALEGLPYGFTGSDDQGFWIADRKNPGNKQWYLDLKMQYAAVTRDYALIVRLHNSQTGQPEIVVAGIGMSGTAAAGEMVGDEQLMQQVRQRVGNGFKDHDFEVVISTDVVNGMAGSPKILAVAVW